MSTMARIPFHPHFNCNQISPPLQEACVEIFKEILITCLIKHHCPFIVDAILTL